MPPKNSHHLAKSLKNHFSGAKLGSVEEERSVLLVTCIAQPSQV